MSHARSALVVVQNYLPHPQPLGTFPFVNPRTARYARGGDYHSWFKSKLSDIARELQDNFPHETFLALTDSAPVLERDLAARAGLGWVGKNGCVLHPKRGSFFFIGEIYTTMAQDGAHPPLIPDFCGKCTRCIDACPTQALVAPRVLDARKCISYWTIEAKSSAPPGLREKFGDLFFGCDICQEVCPWNGKIWGDRGRTEPANSRVGLIEDLRLILESSNKNLERQTRGTALQRAGGKGLKRNALVVIGNLILEELRPTVEKISLEETYAELAGWCLNKLNGSLDPDPYSS
jgi:epoxyqueuosine reductase